MRGGRAFVLFDQICVHDPDSSLSHLKEFIYVFACDQQRGRVKRVERSLQWNGFLMSCLFELVLRNAALLLPKPDYYSIVRSPSECD